MMIAEALKKERRKMQSEQRQAASKVENTIVGGCCQLFCGVILALSIWPRASEKEMRFTSCFPPPSYLTCLSLCTHLLL